MNIKKLLLLSVLSVITTGPLWAAEANPAAGAGAGDHGNQKKKFVLIKAPMAKNSTLSLSFDTKESYIVSFPRIDIKFDENGMSFVDITDRPVLLGAYMPFKIQLHRPIDLSRTSDDDYIELMSYSGKITLFTREKYSISPEISEAVSNTLNTLSKLSNPLMTMILGYAKEWNIPRITSPSEDAAAGAGASAANPGA